MVDRGPASLPDVPAAPLADRLMLALGIQPSYVEELGVEEVLGAAVIIRTQAHRFPFAAEDFGAERVLRDALVDAIRHAVEVLDTPGALHFPGVPEALACLRQALTWVDDPAEEVMGG